MKLIKDILRKIMLIYKRSLYGIACLTTRIDDKKVFLESYQGRNCSCNPLGIYNAMMKSEEFADYKFVWSFRNVDKHKTMKNKRTDIVRFESFSYYKAIASSKYIIVNSNLRPFLKPRKGAVLTQTWHGTPFKKIGCDVKKAGNAVTKLSDIAENYTREAKKFDFMVSQSSYCTEKLISAFNLKAVSKEDIIIEVGYPRNDSLFNFNEKTVESIKSRIGIPKDKKVILYAPTFRDNSHSQVGGFIPKTGIEFDKFKQDFGDEYVVLFRTHYFIADSLDLSAYKGFVFDVSKEEDINDLYIVSDILITDYSSVFFDYANLERPIVFYMYDQDEYKYQIRDMYFDVSELPGEVCKTQDELTTIVKNIPDNFELNSKYAAFNMKYNYLDEKDCGLKVARIITEK